MTRWEVVRWVGAFLVDRALYLLWYGWWLTKIGYGYAGRCFVVIAVGMKFRLRAINAWLIEHESEA